MEKVQGGTTSPQKLVEELAALAEGAFAVVEGALVGAVFDFDADGAVVAGVGEGGEELAPVHVAEPRQFRLVPAEPEGADFVETVAVDPLVLGVDVDDVRAELADGPGAVDELPYKVRRIEVQS